MKDVIKLIANVMNDFHDMFIQLFEILGLTVTDKELHFWVIGIFGIGFFFFTHVVFKWISKYSITFLSFIYTFTVLVVIVFAIEIQQKITNRGNMEFEDAVIGLWGFLVFFFIYIGCYFIITSLKKLFRRKKRVKPKARGSSRMNKYHSS
ncbi:hypothetical protein [Bacillus sp. FJAT-47783]|uniref:hypothetical protein n=1 Tax=Bacillus sp. FJAT-47783 TaxID=2922712 RepID=UPI001FADD06F|nr:hypothetical protein [Bacillus sp. FJAT-47783]